ncbi:hypothetical protein E4U41_006465 [Claviceps citrina]|nr:hypothetical protein E4U41_006465 [Claviceps citrina]
MQGWPSTSRIMFFRNQDPLTEQRDYKTGTAAEHSLQKKPPLTPKALDLPASPRGASRPTSGWREVKVGGHPDSAVVQN